MVQAFPHGYALLIGVGTTSYTPWSLPVTVNDVKAIRMVLTDPDLCGYPDDDGHLRLLSDGAATRGGILDGLSWLGRRVATDSEATAVVYYSGHGWLDQSTGRYFLIPHNVAEDDVPGSALAAEDFTKVLREVQARRLLVMIDSCHAQGMATSKEQAQPLKLPPGLALAAPTESKGLLDALKQGEGRVVFTSSRGRQVSWVRNDCSLSVFTHHLLEALQGTGSRPGNTEVRWSHLVDHLGKAVPLSARQMHNAEQVPFFDTAAEDFPVALLRGGKGLPAAGGEGATPQALEVIRQVANVIASGERAVAVGGSVTGGTIITGDQHGTGRSTGKKRT
jgi:uncharacterized caspase-like protein